MQNLTETIYAAHNLTIEFDLTRWALLNGARQPDQPNTLPPLVEARPDRIVCSQAFAKARQIPGEGQLIPADVARVVVGWAPESRNWRMGLLIAARPETNYQMRWCGLASWPSGATTEHFDEAKQAGQSLARVIGRPFHLVPAPTRAVNLISDTQPLQATAPMMSVDMAPLRLMIEPKTPPFEFENWSLNAVPRGLIWQHDTRWVLGAALRVPVLAILSVLFFVLGIGSQTSGMASVEPAWLPWAGLAVGAALVVMTVLHFRSLLVTSDIVIDSTVREVRCQSRFLGITRWRVPFAEVAYVLVSQTPAHTSHRETGGGPVSTTQNVWLHLYDGRRFWEIAALGAIEGHCHNWYTVRHLQKQRGRRRLQLNNYDTPAHHAAWVMAEVLQTDIWLDIR
ncbi:MAG: hypothetical protein JW966_07250 [Anaerolineae bacterium]|nr:hypothetical protein [Anaerolineae bacterium]